MDNNKKRYRSKYGEECAKCGGVDLEYSNISEHGEGYERKFYHCPDCGAFGEETWYVELSENIVVEDESEGEYNVV